MEPKLNKRYEASRLWKSRSEEKSKTRTFPPRLEIRQTRGFPLSHSPGGDGYLSFIWQTGEQKPNPDLVEINLSQAKNGLDIGVHLTPPSTKPAANDGDRHAEDRDVERRPDLR